MAKSHHKRNTASIPLRSSQFDVSDKRKEKEEKRAKQLHKRGRSKKRR